MYSLNPLQDLHPLEKSKITLNISALIQELDRWEERLEELFAGRPYDIYDAALTATISDFPVSIQPFRDMVRSYQLVERRISPTLLTVEGH